MLEWIKRKMSAMGIENWKLLMRESEVKTAHFTPFPSFYKPSLTHTFEERQVTLSLYKEFLFNGRLMLGYNTVEWEGEDCPDAEIVFAWQEIEKNPIPFFPLELQQQRISQPFMSSFSHIPLQKWIDPIQNKILESCKNDSFVLLSDFIRMEKENRYYLDSYHRELEGENYHLNLDLMLASKTNNSSPPIDAEAMYGEFDPALIAAYVKEQGFKAQQLADIKLWAHQRVERIFVYGSLVADIVNLVVQNLTGLRIYTNSSKERKGQYLYGEKPHGDAMTLKALASLSNSPFSDYFDAQGIIIRSQDILKDGIVQNILTSQETAYYLSLPLTGMNENFSLAPGSIKKEELATPLTLIILQWRYFDFNETTGEFYAEAEHAVFYDQNHQVIPYAGLSLQGKLDQLILNTGFSQEIGVWENYQGPAFLQIPTSFLCP